MLGARLTKQAVMTAVSVRKASSLPSALYNTVWRKSNTLYITYIATGCVVLGTLYGGFMDFAWESNNRGKLYHQINWSKFKTEDDE